MWLRALPCWLVTDSSVPQKHHPRVSGSLPDAGRQDLKGPESALAQNPWLACLASNLSQDTLLSCFDLLCPCGFASSSSVVFGLKISLGPVCLSIKWEE